MYARVTLLEIDPLRTDVDAAAELFRTAVLPQVREQGGYRGVYVLATDEGKALLVSLWDTAESADAQSDSGWYAEELARYVTLFRAPPGRERYRVVVTDVPVVAKT